MPIASSEPWTREGTGPRPARRSLRAGFPRASSQLTTDGALQSVFSFWPSPVPRDTGTPPTRATPLRLEASGLYSQRVLPTALMTAALMTAAPVAPTHLASSLAQPQADPSWDEDEGSAEDASEEGPAEGEGAPSDTEATDEVAPAAPVQPATPLAVEPMAPKTVDDIVIPDNKGVGMMAAAGAVGAVGWGVMAWRIARIKRLCTADDVDVMSVSQDDLEGITESAGQCFLSARGGNAGLWVLQALPNAVNWGLAPGAATVRAKYDAVRSVKTGEIQRKPAVYIGTGAALLGAGAIGRVVVAVIRIRAINPVRGIAANCIDGADTQADEFFDCYANRNALLYGMHQLTSSAVAGGAGLLAYGVVYKRERRNYERNYGVEKAAKLEFTVQPQLSLDYSGVSANLRF